MSLLTVLCVYLLILAGGIVRMSGSGMGCPDWPKCFGQWVPPTTEAELPADYRQRFDDHGHGVAPFNALKTWTEYINRLIGVLSGFFVLGSVLAAWPLRRRQPPVWWLAVASFLLIAFQGWLGSRVVASNLAPLMVTIHMLVALLIVSLLVTAATLTWRHRLPPLPPRSQGLLPWILLAVFLVLVQIVLGTQVREEIDVIAQNLGPAQRDSWVEQLGAVFLVHRSLSQAVTLVLVFLVIKSWSSPYPRQLRYLIAGTLGVLLAMLGTGLALNYAGFPAWAQPIHLLGGTLLFGLLVSQGLFVLYGFRNPAASPL